MKAAMTVAGVCAVRDARDLIAFVCGHYLRVGFGHLAFVDDGSSDGTFEFLEELSRRESRVSVRRVAEPVFRQALLTSTTANELIARGFSIIVPFDADEFWRVTGPALEHRYAGVSATHAEGRWVNFVQNRAAVEPRAASLLGIRYRASLTDGNRATVEGGSRPFVSFVQSKVLCKAAGEIEFSMGQHSVTGGVGSLAGAPFEIFHVPLRYRSEIIKRGANYEPRIAAVRPDPEVAWQSRFHGEVVLANRVDAVWAANSADRRGYLDCNGARIGLVRDDRLRILLWRSWAYLAWRYGIRATA
jgi:hypothetical protein